MANTINKIIRNGTEYEIKDTTYTAGTGISIDSNNVISNTQTSAEWWNITWTLSDQTDLNTALDAKQDKLNAWEWIAIGTAHSDMQWPCPDGFHVPLSTERQAVYNIWTALGGWSSDWTNFWIALKLPFAGRRERLSSIVSGQGSNGCYWSSTPYNSNNAYSLYFNSSNIYHQDNDSRSYAFSVRCFKNTPVIPTSSWTKLYWTSIEAGWIFWSSTDWLISLSSDWQTWVTIADKNLWATTVWNSWNTLSEANCWKYYQRWNNYGFPFTWSVTTSSTQVDASTYWPWNYYSSSTFITRSSSPYRWDTTDNWNLRWWVSQWTWIWWDWNTIVNTGVLSVNGQTWDISNVVTWDAQYVINVSTTAPASWTASNIITIVTD